MGQQDKQQVLLELQELLADRGIQLPELRFGQHRSLCPECQGGSSRAGSGHAAAGGSSSSNGATVSGISMGVTDVAQEQQAAAVPPDTSRLRPLSRELLGWLQSRGISQAVLRRNRVAMESSGGRVVNVKYRALPKHFQQSAKGQQVFYGLDDIQGSPAVLIVEGELDKLSVEEATGATAILSVPAGASAPPSSAAARQQQQQLSGAAHSSINSSSGQSLCWGDRKYAYAQQAMPLLQHCSNSVIGVDADAAGLHTAQQLADRLGRQRCWYLPWPAAVPAGADALQRVASAAAAEGLCVDVAAGLGCKDANDLLMCYGKRVLALYVKTAPLRFPLQ
ncbi:hypothetical protein COO60DRAFT_1635883 [Scenedesmus sp. NREL 46B-D3]|nr:hypothetical protein COO60DRAFT_1635883 [Scenedesmus sp. NREL 46B-D3]